jgi:hypothetical protein
VNLPFDQERIEAAGWTVETSGSTAVITQGEGGNRIVVRAMVVDGQMRLNPSASAAQRALIASLNAS